MLAAITAEELASTPVLSEPLVVESKLGGLPGNEVGWHVGLSVGGKVMGGPSVHDGVVYPGISAIGRNRQLGETGAQLTGGQARRIVEDLGGTLELQAGRPVAGP